jgi:hypothetical protein
MDVKIPPNSFWVVFQQLPEEAAPSVRSMHNTVKAAQKARDREDLEAQTLEGYEGVSYCVKEYQIAKPSSLDYVWPDASDRVAFAEERVDKAEGLLKQIQHIIQTEAAGNPLVTVEKIPEWLTNYFATVRAADDVTLGQIKSLTRELWLANEKLRAGGSVEGLPVGASEGQVLDSTGEYRDATTDEIAEAARDYDAWRSKT